MKYIHNAVLVITDASLGKVREMGLEKKVKKPFKKLKKLYL